MRAELPVSIFVAIALPALPAAAETNRPPVAAEETDEQEVRDDDVIVVGRVYGRQVGKTGTPLKDVPNTISIIDREQIEAQNLLSLEDAMTVTNGVTVNGVGSEDPSYLSRGFVINNYLLDGVPTLSFAFPSVVPDLFAYEKVEVLRGPAGLFAGTGNPAGSINMVRKRPLESLVARASAGYGSWDNVRLELDVSTPLGDHAGLRGGVMLQDQDQFFDVAHRNRLNAFAVGDLDIGDATTLTYGFSYDRYKPAIQTGLPGLVGGADGSEGRLLDVDRSTYLGGDWNRFRSEIKSGFVELAHRIGEKWTLRATGLFTDTERYDVYSYIGSQPITPSNRGVTQHIAYAGDSSATTRAVDVNATGGFTLFGLDQALILGADYQAQDYTSYFTRLSNYATINVYDPISPAEPPLNPYGPSPLYPVQGSNANCSAVTRPSPVCVAQVYGGSNTIVEQYGLYGQARLQPLRGLTVTGGGRMVWWEQTGLTLLSPTIAPPYYPTRTAINGRFTPYAGIVWDATPHLNLYASYADSFTPQATPAGRTRPGGGPVDPLIGSQYEVGSKLSLFGNRLLLSAAGYQITQTNRLFTPPELPTLVLQTGKVRARGIELEVNGQIVPDWRINGGYSYTTTKYLEDTQPQFEGLALTPVIPKHMAKLFTNYAPQSGPLAGFSLGGGVTAFGKTFGGTPSILNANGTRTISSIVRQPAYAVFDLRGGYAFSERLSVSVNVNNVLDKTYYARISSTSRGNFYGSPRSAFATLRVAFP